MNEIRIGRVSSVNYQLGTCRVVYHDRQDEVTREIPMLATEYNMPEVGDMVLVLHLSNGSSMGVILGCMWNSEHQPPEGKKGVFRKDLDHEGNSFMRCEEGVITLHAQRIVLDADEVTFGGGNASGGNLHMQNISVSGNVTAQEVSADGVSLREHTHNYSGGITGGANA